MPTNNDKQSWGVDPRLDQNPKASSLAIGDTADRRGYPFVERRRGERRQSGDGSTWQSIVLNAGLEIRINFMGKEVVVRGAKVGLTPKEFDFLCLLASQPGRVFSDAEILERLWADNMGASSTHVAQYAHRLRKKLGDDAAHPQCLINVKRFGYKLNGEPAVHATSSFPAP